MILKFINQHESTRRYYGERGDPLLCDGLPCGCRPLIRRVNSEGLLIPMAGYEHLRECPGPFDCPGSVIFDGLSRSFRERYLKERVVGLSESGI